MWMLPFVLTAILLLDMKLTGLTWMLPFVLTAILDDLLKQGRLSGSVSGGRQDKSVFYPDIYTRAQNQWLDSFYAQNGYLGERERERVCVCVGWEGGDGGGGGGVGVERIL